MWNTHDASPPLVAVAIRNQQKHEQQMPHRPPAPRDGPFGWGTDWVEGVALPAAGGGGRAEDIMEPAECRDAEESRNFVEGVLARREKRQRPKEASERVSA